MKKLIVLFAVAAALISCGKDKKNFEQETPKSTAVSLEVVGIFAEDDSLAVFYKVDGFYMYDKPVTKVIKGSKITQKITFDIPAGIAPENFSIVASTNKNQTAVTISEVTIHDGDNVIDGKNYQYFDFFVADNSFKLDEKTMIFSLTHTNQYPPGMVGTPKLETLLIK